MAHIGYIDRMDIQSMDALSQSGIFTGAIVVAQLLAQAIKTAAEKMWPRGGDEMRRIEAKLETLTAKLDLLMRDVSEMRGKMD